MPEVDVNQLEIVNNEAENRFEAKLGRGKYAVVEYMRGGPDVIIYTHTEVPQEFEGMGIANKLGHAVMEYAKSEGLKVRPLCPFIKLYVSRHPEYQSITLDY